MAGKPSDSLPVKSVAFEFKGIEVLQDNEQFISLTDMWKAQGSPANQNPYEWSRRGGAEFINSLAQSLHTAKSRVIKSRKGKGVTGTWAHWQVALAYAKYLSPEFHRFVNEAFREWTEEKINPEIKFDRAADALIERGATAEWVERRFKGKCTRKALTGGMADHNCRNKGPSNNPYAEGTRSIAIQVQGMTPREFREEKGLKKSDATRDHYSYEELLSIEWAEAQALKLIKTTAADGNEACVECCRRAGAAVRKALDSLNVNP